MASRQPRVKSRQRQPTTGTGRVVGRSPGTRRVFAPSWGQPVRAPRPVTGVPAAGATASTVAVTPYSVSNLPPDADWAATVGLLQRQRDENVAAVAGERTRTLSDYGFQEGPGGALTFDPNNPFSKASLLKKTYDTNRRSTAQSLAAGGQLYSGASQNAQDLIGRNQLQAEGAQWEALQAFVASTTGRRARSAWLRRWTQASLKRAVQDTLREPHVRSPELAASSPDAHRPSPPRR